MRLAFTNLRNLVLAFTNLCNLAQPGRSKCYKKAVFVNNS